MKKVIFITGLWFLLFSAGSISAQVVNQPSNGTKVIVKKPVYFDVSPPLSELIKNAPVVKIDPEEAERREELIEQAIDKFLLSKRTGTFRKSPDPLSKIQQNYKASNIKSNPLTELANFDGVDNIDGVNPPDTQGDVGDGYYMQCVNNHTAIYSKNGDVIKNPFPTSAFWAGTDYDDRNDGDPVILWDETAKRWIVTQFYVPETGTQYLLLAISKTSDPTGEYYRYAFDFQYMPDYPKWAIWHDGYYFGANAFDQSNNYTYKGVYLGALDRNAALSGDPNATFVSIFDSYKWAVFPTDADVLPDASIGGCFYITDDVGTSDNTSVYLYQLNVDWTNKTASLSNVKTFSVASYDLFSSDEQVPQNGTTQKLSLLQSRIMYRPYFRPFSDHNSIVMCRTVNDNGIAAVRWYEFRNSGSGWSVYQQGTYNPGDGLWRWMPSIAMNENGDIALGFSVSSSSTYPAIHCVARYANDNVNVMTSDELEVYKSTDAQTGNNRWGDYSMVSIEPSDNKTFWFTTEYTTGSWSWKTRIVHFALPTSCTPPVTQANSFTPSDIEDYNATVSWNRGSGDKVIVLAHEGSAVDADPVSGASYLADAQFGSGTQIGTGNYVVYNGVDTFVTVTGLKAGTKYYFAIYEYNTADNCYLTPALTGDITTTQTQPSISVSKNSLDFGKLGMGFTRIGVYEVSGINLTDDIVVTGSDDFLVSTDSVNFSSSVSVPQTSGNANSKIFVKFAPSNIQDYSTTITNTSQGAITQNVECTGKGVQWFNPPRNLTAITSSSRVILSWDEPSMGGSSANWYEYANLSTADAYLGPDYILQIVKFVSEDLNYNYPIKITKLKAAFYESSTSSWTSNKFKFIIMGLNKDTIFMSSELTASSQQETSYTLPSPIILTGDFYMGIATVASDGTPYLLVKKMPDNNYHSYVFDGSSWYIVTNGTNAYDYTLSIYIDNNAKGQEIVASTGKGSITAKKFIEPTDIILNTNGRKSALKAYKIYRDNTEYATVDANTTNYTDVDGEGEHTYYVTALYQDYDGESEPTNSVTTNAVAAVDDVQDQIVSVYPNPTTGKFTVMLNNSDDEYNVEITDINGKRVYTGKITQKQNTIDLNGKASGVYILKVYNRSYNTVMKLVVK